MTDMASGSAAGAVLITGAGRGVGRGLALRFARRAATDKRPCRLILTARTAEGLAQTAADCRALGAEVMTEYFDIGDTAVLRKWLVAADDMWPVDCAILN